MIDDKDKLIAALKLRLGGQCCEVCWTNSWVPIESEADANGVNMIENPNGTFARCDFCWQEWATGQLIRQYSERIQQLAGEVEIPSQATELTRLQNEVCTAMDQIPPDLEGDSLSVALIKLNDERHRLAKQYADMKTYAEFLEKKYGHKEAP